MTKISPEKKLQMYLKRDSCDGRRWMHNSSGEHMRVKPHLIKAMLNFGWCEGRIMKRNRSGQFTK